MYPHEFMIDSTDLPLKSSEAWLNLETGILSELGSLVIAVTQRMNEIEPDYDNFVYIRVPIEV